MAVNDSLASQLLDDGCGLHELGLCRLGVALLNGRVEDLELGTHGGTEVPVPAALFAVLLDSLDCAFVVGHGWTPKSRNF